jgi:hypothetical protein
MHDDKIVGFRVPDEKNIKWIKEENDGAGQDKI